MATIGGVCVQWALLELTLAHIIWAFLNMDEDTGAIVTGGLDMLPRVNMAINLAEHKRAPLPARKSLRSIRKAVQDTQLDRRNQAVHGAHRIADEGDGTILKMLRWPKEKRHQKVTGIDLYNLSVEIHRQVELADRIYEDIGVWLYGPKHGPEDAGDGRGS